MRRFLLVVLALLVVGGGVTAFVASRESEADREAEAHCAGGAKGGDEAEREREEAEQEREREEGEEGRAKNELFSGPAESEPPCGEVAGQPETFADLAKANGGIVARSVAPGDRIRTGAYRSAVRQRASLPTVGETWSPFGKPPLQSYRTEYDQTAGSTNQGLGDLSGRATAVTRIDGALYAAISNGGIWKSTDNGDTWTSIGENLPTQVVAGIAGSAGNLLVLTGDNAFGGNTYAGLGAYRSTDGGKSWTHASGIPDGLLAFRLAADPTDPKTFYAATGGGLFRSTDGGASYTNVDLPTGDCAGKPTSAKDCFLANVVTDVVVQAPANAKTAGGKPGAVMAAVGWRSGTKPNANGVPQAPHNGIYVSDTGAPGSFKDMDIAGHSTATTDPLNQARLGRIALGAATGADQDHRVVYAIIQDAVKFNGGVTGLDVNENGTTTAAQSDYLNGVWVSTDFGAELEGARGLDDDRRGPVEQLRPQPAGVQGARGRGLLPRHPGLVQPVGRAGPDAPDRRGRPDAARLRPRGDLDEHRSPAVADGARRLRPGQVRRRRSLLRGRRVHAAQRDEGAAHLPHRRGWAGAEVHHPS